MFTAAETGTLMAFAFLAGVAQKEGLLHQGRVAVRLRASGGGGRAHGVRLGSLFSSAFLAGGRIREKNRAGSLTPDTSISGPDVFTAAELGTLIAMSRLAGGRNVDREPRGSLWLSGVCSVSGAAAASTFLMLGPI